MKTKLKSVMLKRAREAKMIKNYYFGLQLPMQEGILSFAGNKHQYN